MRLPMRLAVVLTLALVSVPAPGEAAFYLDFDFNGAPEGTPGSVLVWVYANGTAEYTGASPETFTDLVVSSPDAFSTAPLMLSPWTRDTRMYVTDDSAGQRYPITSAKVGAGAPGTFEMDLGTPLTLTPGGIISLYIFGPLKISGGTYGSFATGVHDIGLAGLFDYGTHSYMLVRLPDAHYIPEPASLGLLGLGLAASAWGWRRKHV